MRLQRGDGKALTLGQALGDGRPVVMTFMYSSCQTVCPITNQIMVELGRLLGPQESKVHLVSISIDPDYDTVRRLADYARKTGNHGSFFTGDPAASEDVQRAFDVWRGDKMHHEAVFLISKGVPGDGQWIRLSGLVTPRELLSELHALAPDVLATSK